MRARLRQMHSRQAGFSLIELLAAMSIGMVLLLAAFYVLDHANALTQEVANRQEAIQKGRLAMERMTRQLRSQVCLGDTTEPITFGDPTRVSFYSDLSDGSKNVQSRTLSYASGKFEERIFYGAGVYPDLTFPGAPSEINTVLEKAEPVKIGAAIQPVFRYFGFRAGGAPGDLEELPVPLSSDNASRVVMVKIQFVSTPVRLNPKDKEASTLQSDVYVRLADPSRPTEGPRCL